MLRTPAVLAWHADREAATAAPPRRLDPLAGGARRLGTGPRGR